MNETTISQEQIEDVSKAYFDEFLHPGQFLDPDGEFPTWDEMSRRERYFTRMQVEFILRCAGLRIEGE